MLNKKIILTGATGGVGREITRLLHQHGASIVITSRRAQALKDLAQNINGRGQVFPIAYDFNNLSGVDDFIKKALVCLQGKVDVLINNAGIGYHSKIENIVLSELEEVFRVNSLGPILLTSKLLPYLRNSKNAHVVNISSFLGEKAMKYTAVYTATKHALNGFSKTLRLEEASMGIKVTLIEPGAIETDFILKTHDEETKELFSKRKLRKIPPQTIADWVLKVIETEYSVCPEVIRIIPTKQAI